MPFVIVSDPMGGRYYIGSMAGIVLMSQPLEGKGDGIYRPPKRDGSQGLGALHRCPFNGPDRPRRRPVRPLAVTSDTRSLHRDAGGSFLTRRRLGNA